MMVGNSEFIDRTATGFNIFCGITSTSLMLLIFLTVNSKVANNELSTRNVWLVV